ncbi:MAG: nucleoside kinase [Bacteroidales bacterium]|jgi:uridine kinase|nr:nucleoside kinase [Bacteroidales bacterium]
MIEIKCVNTNSIVLINEGENLFEVLKSCGIKNEDKKILGAYVNNKVQNMYYKVYTSKRVEFITMDNPNGRRMYALSLMFLLYKAVRECFPNGELRILHSLSEGYYAEINNIDIDKDNVIPSLKLKMTEIVKSDIPFERTIIEADKAAALFEKAGIDEKTELIRGRGRLFTKMDYLDGMLNTFFFELVPSTSYLKAFDLRLFHKGFILVMPSQNKVRTKANSKLFSVFQEHKHWIEILNTPYVSDLNRLIDTGKQKEIIMVSEALHEKKYAEIADDIFIRRNDVKIVLLAGPSSSGKTTSCKRLATQLAVLGFSPLQISLDDYFVNREFTPKDSDGNMDFEALNALDLEYFNFQMQSLLKGEKIELPKFNFFTGEREQSGKLLSMKSNSILIVEGIHALNPVLSQKIARKNKYHIFVSALTQVAIDRHNLINTSDNRLLRRILRDNQFRGYNAEATISRWQSVREGEEKHIFPYQENADSIFNSSLLYEINVMKKVIEPLLAEVPEVSSAYAEARRLRNFLSLFKSIDNADIVPQNSVMREFLGGSSFDY